MAFGRSLVTDSNGNYKGPLTLSLKQGYVRLRLFHLPEPSQCHFHFLFDFSITVRTTEERIAVLEFASYVYGSSLQVTSGDAREQRGHGAPCRVPVVQPPREHHVREGEAIDSGGPQPAPVAHQGHDALAASPDCGNGRHAETTPWQQRRNHWLLPRAAGHARPGLGHGRARGACHDGRRAGEANGDGALQQHQQEDGARRHRRVPAVDGWAQEVQQAPPPAHPEAPVLGDDVAHRVAGLKRPDRTSPRRRHSRWI
uniref:Uncharacterized protein n=1 Tax=Aegilops tauschii subsp. strangulata TaxID=200361 RepID=A0A452Z2H7_AEGTS